MVGMQQVVQLLDFQLCGLIEMDYQKKKCFGLLHGLGFASMFTQIGLEGSDYLIILFSFNLGVEIGQLLVLTPFILITPILSRISWYRVIISIPASIIIALVGLKMFVERVI